MTLRSYIVFHYNLCYSIQPAETLLHKTCKNDDIGKVGTGGITQGTTYNSDRMFMDLGNRTKRHLKEMEAL
jgi:hypothetical protein